MVSLWQNVNLLKGSEYIYKPLYVIFNILHETSITYKQYHKAIFAVWWCHLWSCLNTAIFTAQALCGLCTRMIRKPLKGWKSRAVVQMWKPLHVFKVSFCNCVSYPWSTEWGSYLVVVYQIENQVYVSVYWLVLSQLRFHFIQPVDECLEGICKLTREQQGLLQLVLSAGEHK